MAVDETPMSSGCRDWTGVSGSLTGNLCSVEYVVVYVVGAGVSGRSSWILVVVLSARSELRGGLCTATGV